MNAQSEYDRLRARVERDQGPLHAGFLRLPPSTQLDALRKAAKGEMVLDEERIESFLADANVRLALVKRLAKVMVAKN